MTRANCQQPDACVAGKRGPCRLCADLTAHAERGRERMRRLHQDPEFAAARDERGRERMRRLNQDPEFAAMMARYRRGHGIPIPDWVPDDLCADYADTAREQGEEAAAAHVRRLKREAA